MTADADKTRQALLKAAYEEIHRNGFQAASLNAILDRTGVTKGALYHHFSSKLQLGYAVLDEEISKRLEQRWFKPMMKNGHPIDVLIAVIQQAEDRIPEKEIQLGCPINNLAQEMSSIDAGFRLRIDNTYRRLQMHIAELLRKGQQQGKVCKTTDIADAALFILASMEGCMSIAKSSQSLAELKRCGKGLAHYLNSLRT